MAKVFHVYHRSDGSWSVRRGGAAKASKTFETKASATGYARTIAKNTAGELVVHDRNGMIHEMANYAANAAPPTR